MAKAFKGKFYQPLALTKSERSFTVGLLDNQIRECIKQRRNLMGLDGTAFDRLIYEELGKRLAVCSRIKSKLTCEG